MGDPNFQIALDLSRGFAAGELGLPHELADVETRAQLVDEIDGLLLVDGQGAWRFDMLGARVRAMADQTETVIASVPHPFDRAAVALRIWAGCVIAAKTIALETRSGANTSADRAALFGTIDEVAAGDPLFRAGVEAAPAFKRRRNQPCELDGVPEGSSVRRYA